jgi:hypothetical protein
MRYEQAVAEMARLYKGELHRGSNWMHLKTGNEYCAHNIIILETDLSLYVTYSRWGPNHVVWTRPVVEFLDGRYRNID